MKKKYTHLTQEEREQLSVLHARQTTVSEIARILGRSKSTISRELNRPTSRFFRGAYLGETSGKNYSVKWSQCHKKARLKNPTIEKYVLRKLKQYWAPERIAGRLKYLYKLSISAECIYQYIYDGHRDLTKYLPRKHMARKKSWQYRKKKKENIPNRIDIDFRPKEADDRLVFGHFEADCIVSCKGSKSALLVLVDRLTRKTKIKKLERKIASLTSSSIVYALSVYNSSQIHSITYDNGCEFSKHELVNEKLGCNSYFCKPYHAWEKGTVENINGLIRRFFPKGTNFDTITDEDIIKMENWINNLPMKVLGFKTPNEMALVA